jgi:integrase
VGPRYRRAYVVKLTLTRIEALECPAAKRDALFFDDEQRGLAVRVTASGGKTFLAQYSLRGHKHRIPLGSCNAVSLAKARAAVRAIMGHLAQGEDPAAERKKAASEARAQAYTLSALLLDWQALHLASKSPRYSKDALRGLRHAFAHYLNTPATAIDRKIIVNVIDAMARKGSPVMAAQVGAYGKAAYGWAVKRGTLAVNPFLNLPLATRVRRDRVLSDDEIRAIWSATDGPGPFNAIVRLLLLTGQRRSEVGGMAWSELSDDLTTWTIPAGRTKNNTAHIVPLSAPVRELLRNIPRSSGELVLSGGDRPFNGFSRAKPALDARLGVTGWRIHDLRRTTATGLQRLGIRLEVTEAVLNHISGSRAGVVGIYQRHDWSAEKRAALDAWGEHVMAVVEGRPVASNVTVLR